MDEYKIVVIDRTGYGMSDDTTVPQTGEHTAEMDRLWEINGKTNRKSRERFIDSYIEKLGNCKYENIPGDHYIYAYKTDEVEQAVSEFLEELEK
jgi:hypothetical protein